jgi:hypothetical protein
MVGCSSASIGRGSSAVVVVVVMGASMGGSSSFVGDGA